MRVRLEGVQAVINSLMTDTVTITRLAKTRFSEGMYIEDTTTIYDGKALVAAQGDPFQFTVGSNAVRRSQFTVMIPVGSADIEPFDKMLYNGQNLVITGSLVGTYEGALRISAYLDVPEP